MTYPDQARPSVTVLFVCTGNICRSPVAERLGRSILDGAMGPGVTAVKLHSAGVRAVVGSGMHPDSARALQRYVADVSDFRARRLRESMVLEADLVLTMTREHLRQVLELSPRALGRSFTLREAAGLLNAVGDLSTPEVREPVDDIGDWVRLLAAARSRRRSGPDDDIRDPVGLPFAVHQEAVADIATALDPVLRRLAGLVEGDRRPHPRDTTPRREAAPEDAAE